MIPSILVHDAVCHVADNHCLCTLDETRGSHASFKGGEGHPARSSPDAPRPSDCSGGPQCHHATSVSSPARS